MTSFNIFSENLTKILKNTGIKSSKNEISGSENFQDDKFFLSQRALWRAVILQAIIDILNESSRTENKIAKLEAKKWIFTNNEDFEYVCLMAGYKINFIRKKILEIMRKSLCAKVIINQHAANKKENKFFLIVNWNLYCKSL
jgi:hypothetical protein